MYYDIEVHQFGDAVMAAFIEIRYYCYYYNVSQRFGGWERLVGGQGAGRTICYNELSEKNNEIIFFIVYKRDNSNNNLCLLAMHKRIKCII